MQMSESRGVTVKDVSAHEFVVQYAAHLKKQGKIQLPELVDLVKTGVSKELAPYNDDWFYVRCGETIPMPHTLPDGRTETGTDVSMIGLQSG